MDDDDDEAMDGDVGSPSPPFEGIIREEPEKQLESQGGDFENRKDDMDEPFKEVNMIEKIN